MTVSITLRNTKGSALTFTEMDTNLTNLKTAVEAVDTTALVTTSTSQTITGAKTINDLTLKKYRETVYDLGTTGGTQAPDASNGSIQKITLSSSLTINAFTNPVSGQSITLIIYGGTAYTSITSTMKFAGGNKSLTGTSGCIDILNITYDGTTYFAALTKGYA
jgi:hypothetical protein